MATRTLDVDGSDEARPTVTLAGEDAEMLADGTAVYKGLAGYKDYINKKAEKVTQANAGGIRAGPLRAATNVRISSRFDYQPDICKDYKETGYCGYGDSCKFMHDRSDYKAGWQIDKDWDAQQREKQAKMDPNKFLIDSDGDDDDNADGQDSFTKVFGADGTSKTKKPKKDSDAAADDDNLPFACLICRGPFKNPVVTKCNHYYCEQCALTQYAKTAKCFACGVATGGVFNIPKDLVARLKLRKEQMAAREAEIRSSLKDVEGIDLQAEEGDEEERDGDKE
eukprot:jgi/Hompol1/6559/HPOL_000749-RA